MNVAMYYSSGLTIMRTTMWQLCILDSHPCQDDRETARPSKLPFSSNQTDLSSIQQNSAQDPMFLTDNRHDSRKIMILICNLNTPLARTMSSYPAAG